MNADRLNNTGKQKGVTLFVALVFLLALSMLGIWGATGNALQERMAGNTRNRDLAFEAAEAALEEAEVKIGSWRVLEPNGLRGVYKYLAVNSTNTLTPNQPNTTSFWINDDRSINYIEASFNNAQIAAPPQYVIEKMPNKNNLEFYRITARGVGGDSNAVVILQSIISYRP